MNNFVVMDASFERIKNIKATFYTAIICGLLFFLFFFLQWTLPQIPVPVADEGIEVNLGNSETGLGSVAPQLPGESTATNETNIAPPVPVKAAPVQQNIQATDHANNDDEAVAEKVNKVIAKTNHKPAPESKAPKKNVVTAPVTVVKPAKPKALYQGGNASGNGGNNADSYNGVTNQGIAGGKGDQGNPNGNPNSDSYKGNAASGNGSGIAIPSHLKNRGVRLPSLQDDFNENAKVAVDITVDANGNVSAAMIQPRGTTTTNPSLRNIAITKARQLKFGKSANDNEIGTIVFNFRVTN